MHIANEENKGQKTTSSYWDESWERRPRTPSGSSNIKEPNNYFWRRLNAVFSNIFQSLDAPNSRLIEVGAGASDWLPHLHHRFGFSIAGIDYSEVGCRIARDNLVRASASGTIYTGDMFDPPPELLGQFDVAVSFGLVEHFENTGVAVSACAAFVRPGGIVLTLIPNMRGLYGALYKVFNRKVYDTHVPLTLRELMDAHRDAGLNVFFYHHILGIPGVVEQNRKESSFVRRALRRVMFQISRIVWTLEEKGFGIPENRISSPYMVCVARKPGQIG
jgi:2-polyprenyl-3-methyl-5-hydroxy-6-metoxy-1,4-benzoquinol methylase